MAQLADITGGKLEKQNLSVLLSLLEERHLNYKVLAESLVEWRDAYIRRDLSAISRAVEMQSSCCSRIAAANRDIEEYAKIGIAPGAGIWEGLGPAELPQMKMLIAETKSLRAAVARLNSAHSRLVAKAAQQNAILMNLYRNALIYEDPRIHARNSRRWLEG